MCLSLGTSLFYLAIGAERTKRLECNSIIINFPKNWISVSTPGLYALIEWQREAWGRTCLVPRVLFLTLGTRVGETIGDVKFDISPSTTGNEADWIFSFVEICSIFCMWFGINSGNVAAYYFHNYSIVTDMRSHFGNLR